MAVIVGVICIGSALYGMKNGTMGYRRFGAMRVERRKEPVGFWITVMANLVMGATAELYGFGIL